MIRQFSDLREQAEVREECDVCVVGSGCGGASVAALLAERGRKVVILERGGYYTKADFDQREANMLAKIDGGRGLHTAADGSVQLSYGNNVGGASVHYWADSYRTPTDRLKQWQEEFGIEGHDEEALTPHFERIERDLNVHPATDAYVNRMNELLADGARLQGWAVARVPQARKACVGSGHCMQGCAYDAKQSQLVTYIPRALEHDARLYADTRVERLRREGRRVAEIEASLLDRATGRASGTRVRVRARAVVIAAGGYGTPQLLLAQGLKRELPALGRHFFCNPCSMTHALFDEEIVQWRNIPAAWGVEEFRLARFDGTERVFGRPGKGRYREGGYLIMANQLHPASLAAVLPGVGAAHLALMRDLRKIGGAISWIDDVEAGHVTLGQARPRVHVPLSGENGQRLRDAWRKQAQLLLSVGAREVLFGDAADTRVRRAQEIDAAVARIELRPGRNLLAAPHPGGGARMGADARDSVVGFDHRVHGFDNLYVSDPSVFPSPPSVDPSSSILAFSFVAADRIHAAL
jgi:choline dehydrogenase-like flavoprotein